MSVQAADSSIARQGNRAALPLESSSESRLKKDVVLARLRAQLRRVESPGPNSSSRIIASGYRALDRLLPNVGLRRGTLLELLGQPGSGAGTLGLQWAARVAGSDGTIVVIDGTGQFYPPASVGCGIDLQRLLVVRSAQTSWQLWAWEQSLQCTMVAAVWGMLARLAPVDYRRLALAAEQGSTLGVLLRPERVLGQACWADVQLRVQPLSCSEQQAGGSRRVRVHVTRCRHGVRGRSVELDLGTLTRKMEGQ